MRPILALTVVALATSFVALPSAASAQTLRDQTRQLDAVLRTPQQIISVNPFLPLFGFFQGEYERRINPNASFAIAASHTEWDNDVYTNVDVKLRLYPQEKGLSGLGLASSLGYANIRREGFENCTFTEVDFVCSTEPRKNIGAPAFAVEGQYQWLLGTKKATAVALGFGVKRYFVDKADFQDRSRVLPTGRLTIGYAF